MQTQTTFHPSRFAPMDKPIPRVRQDRNWRDLERSQPPIESWTRSIIGGLILVAFMVLGTAIAWHLPEVGL
jgi:hypothetical protein